MKSTNFAWGALMASVAIAQPHRHQHRDKHQKRALVVVTDYEYVYETVTVWVPKGFQVPAASTTPSPVPYAPAAPTNLLNQDAAKVSTEPVSWPSAAPELIYVAPVPSSTSVAPILAAVPVNTYVAQAPPAEPTPEPEPTPSSTYVAPVYSAPAVEAPVPVYSAPAPAPAPDTTTAAPVAAPTYATTSSDSTGDPCSASNPCQGDITYFEAALGSCGLTSNGNTDKVIALPHGMMGTQSNGNPFCGRTVTIKRGSKSVQATVVDKCMGCDGNSIDLSNAAFQELADFSVGRTQAEWYFNHE